MKELLVQTRDERIARFANGRPGVRVLLENGMKAPAGPRPLRLDGSTLRAGAKLVGRVIRVKDLADQERVVQEARRTPLLVVECPNWKIIPLENLVARLAGRTKLFAVLESVEDAASILHVLERGVDGVLVRPKSVKETRRFLESVQPATIASVELVTATVQAVHRVGSGDRVCIDTASTLEPDEGLLVGSTGHGFFLIASENHASKHVAARPFRVNAGAVHSYVLDGERTFYLSEARAGITVRALRPDGSARTVVVGRAKIETRPLVRIEAEAQGRRFGVLLQDAETVRLVTGPNRTKSVRELRPKDQVLCHLETKARHFGTAISERIIEQ